MARCLLFIVAAAVWLPVVAAGSAQSPAASRYPDPLGDQAVEPRCGDISGLVVSDRRSVVELTVNIRAFRCGEAIVALDTDRDGRWDYDLGFRGTTGSRGAIDHFWPIGADDSIGPDVRKKILSVLHRGDGYTFRFRARDLGVKRAFGFEAHLNGRYMSDVVDTAPDYPKDWFTYRLTGR
ncbi:MAG TPA: hypothetical protein VFJ78_09580 [Gaiellaceae bacterium]|nr:hypothetical protein [Gaiellaceae bacterium]